MTDTKIVVLDRKELLPVLEQLGPLAVTVLLHGGDRQDIRKQLAPAVLMAGEAFDLPGGLAKSSQSGPDLR